MIDSSLRWPLKNFCSMTLQGLLPRLGYGMDTARGLGGMYTNDLYGHNWNPYGLGMGFGSNSFGMARNGYGWTSLQNKYKSRGRGSTFRYGNQDIDGLDELNKGPRGKSYKTGVNMPLNTANDEKDTISTIPEREHRSGADIHDNYSDAKFFIIKSYSEDDVHKSVKYNVWASTPNGNKKLNAAYQEAQEKSGGCAVFLFFSVSIVIYFLSRHFLLLLALLCLLIVFYLFFFSSR